MALPILSESNCEELFGIIESAIPLAASQWPKEFTLRRNALIQKLFSVVKEDDGSDGGVVTKVTDMEMDSSMNSQHTMNNNNVNKEVPSLPKKRLVIKIKLPPLQNQGKDLNNLQVVPQQTKPTVEVEADPTLVMPTSQEAVVKGGDDRPNKLKKDLEEEKFQLKLEATKRKLQERYKQAQDSKKRIRVVELQDVPKRKLLDSSNKKPRNRYRW